MKFAKYIISIVVIIVVAYNAVYFKKLDEVKASNTATAFNATEYAQTFWKTKLAANFDKATDITKLLTMLSTDPAKTFEKYSHALGIGNLRCFLVKGKGIITSINEDDISMLPDSCKQTTTLATEYIFGNAVRDATGLININEFTNTMDFNNVSAELNKIIRQNVLPSFKQQAKKGNIIEFIGAVELNKEHLDFSHLEIVPIKIKISQ